MTVHQLKKSLPHRTKNIAISYLQLDSCLWIFSSCLIIWEWCVCCMSSDFPPSLIFCMLFKLIKFDNTQSSFKNNDFCPHLDVPQLIKCLLTFSPLICYKSVKLRNLIWLFFLCEIVNALMTNRCKLKIIQLVKF